MRRVGQKKKTPTKKKKKITNIMTKARTEKYFPFFLSFFSYDEDAGGSGSICPQRKIPRRRLEVARRAARTPLGD